MKKNIKIFFLASGLGITAFVVLYITLLRTDTRSDLTSSKVPSTISEKKQNKYTPNLVTATESESPTRSGPQQRDLGSQQGKNFTSKSKVKSKEIIQAIAATKKSQEFKKQLTKRSSTTSESILKKHIDYLSGQKSIDSKLIRAKVGKNSRQLKLIQDHEFTNETIILTSDIDTSTNKVISQHAIIASQFILNLNQAELMPSDLKDMQKNLGLKKLTRLGPFQYLATGNPSSTDSHLSMQENLSKHQYVTEINENSVQYMSVIPNDEGIPFLPGLIDPTNDIDIDGEEAWNYNTDCSNVEIAVIDTGADPDHPDLVGSLTTDKARNFTSVDPTAWADDNNHGSHVSGTIGATGNNQIGITGVCWKAKIIPLKVLNAAGTGSDAGIIAAINWTTEQTNAKLINASFGSGVFNQTAKTAIENFCAKGGIFVAAAGNDNNNNNQIPAFPTNYDVNCIVSVAALAQDNELANFSNYGLSVDIAAPGTNIASTGFQGNYIYLSGTSMAAPHITGMLALAWHAKPEITNTNLINMLYESSEKYGNTKPIQLARRANLKNFMETALDVDGETKILWDKMFMGTISGEKTEEIKIKIRAGEIPWESWEEHYLVSDLFNETANKVWQDIFSQEGSAPISSWQDLIRSGKSMQEIKKELTESPEFESLYQKRMIRITGQKALEAEPKEKWISAIQSGQNIETLEKEFILSDSLANHVTKFFQDLFEANPDPKTLEKIQKQLEDPEQSFDLVKQTYLEGPLVAIKINQFFNEILQRNASPEDITSIRAFMKEDYQTESVKEKIKSLSP